MTSHTDRDCPECQMELRDQEDPGVKVFCKGCREQGDCTYDGMRSARVMCRVVIRGLEKVPSLIDTETANAAREIRTIGKRFERVNGTTAEEFLAGLEHQRGRKQG